MVLAFLMGVLAAAPLDSAACAACHVEIAKQWSDSAHAKSGSDPIYLANHAQEPMQWCEDCHSPDRNGPEQDRSISCTTCHVKGGELFGARVPSAQASAAHPMKVEPKLAGAEACAGCHQFNFPVDNNPTTVTLTKHPMQNTLGEWKTLGARRSCQSCHMPNGSHAMPAAHELSRLQKAISVSVSRIPNGEVRVELKAIGAGHRVPTGDPFHRLKVQLCGDAACTQVLSSRELGRTITKMREGWRITRDETLRPDLPTVLEFDAKEALHWRLLYLYASRGVAPRLPEAITQLEIFAGPIDPRTP